MTNKPRTNIYLIVLGVVSVGILGYFSWIFLAPPAKFVPSSEIVPTDVQSGLVGSPSFQSLRPYANLPIEAINVGRLDPFAPFLIQNANSNANSNGNSNSNVNAPTNSQAQ